MTVFRFIEVEKATYPISMLCRLLDVSRSGYHAWRRRPESPRRRSDNALSAWIAHIHRSSRGTYGAPRIHAELRADGTRVGTKRVARLMREAWPGRGVPTPVSPDHGRRRARGGGA